MKPDFIAPDAFADDLAALHEPGVIAALCEDDRATATIDLEHDRASRPPASPSATPRWCCGGEGTGGVVV